MNPLDDLDEDFIIKARIIQTIITEEKSFPFNRFVEYVILLRSSNKSWEIKRRYKNFNSLHLILQKENISLTEFPQKTIFQFRNEVIKKRKFLFENYLNHIITKENIKKIPALKTFLESESRGFRSYSKCATMIHIVNPSYSPEKNLRKNMRKSTETLKNPKLFLSLMPTVAEDECEDNSAFIIENFLKNLEINSGNICEDLNAFVSDLCKGKKWSLISQESIKKMFFGDGNKKRGLIFHLGNSRNWLEAEAYLNFINKLLQFEVNPDYERYRASLRMMRRDVIKNFCFQKLLKFNKSNITRGIFNLVKILIENGRDIDINLIIDDSEMKQMFHSWNMNIESELS